MLTLADGRHVARWRDPWTKKQKQQSLDALGLTNKKQRERWAEDFAANLMEDRQEAAKGRRQPKRMQVREAQDLWLAQKKAANTKSAYQMPMRRFRDYLQKQGVADVVDVTKLHLTGWADELLANDELKPSTRNQHRLSVRVFLYWCDERSLLHPSLQERDIRKSLTSEKEVSDFIEVLQRDDQAKLLQSALAHDADGHDPIAPFVLLVLETGMRLDEARLLTFDEFDLDAPSIYLPAAREKRKKAREITLEESPAAVRLLEALRLQAGGRKRVFPHLGKSQQESVRARLQRDYDAPAFTWAMLRRTCGSLMVCGAVRSTFLTAQRLGHSEQVAARHYHGAIRRVPRNCATVAEAGGWQDKADEIVRRVVAGQAARPRLRARRV